MTEAQISFIDYAVKHGEAIEKGNHKVANKLHKQLMSVYETINQAGKWSELKELFQHPNESVKLWASTFLLKNDNVAALKVLHELAKSPRIIGLTASTTIDMWRKGMLDLL